MELGGNYMRIGLAQLDMDFENKALAKERCLQMLEKAAAAHVDFIVFPEMTLTGFTMKPQLYGEALAQSETLDFFRDAAKKYHIAICFGLPVLTEATAENHCLILSREGRLLADYTKLHPFSFGEESQYYSGGSSLCTCTLEEFSVSPLICYDLRFPEIFQIVSERSALLVVIANWPASRRAHWMTLLTARAIENQSYVIGVNRSGSGGNLDYSGDSMLISPLGDVLAHATESNQLLTADISIEEVEKCRSVFPLKKDRRPALYHSLWESWQS